MAVRRPAHKLAHQPCPYGQSSWASCDVASEHRFGHCKATVGKYEPGECSRWAFDDTGWCTQHYVSKVESERKAQRIAIAKAELGVRIEAHIAWTKVHPSVWERRNAPNGSVVKPTAGRPHRLTSPE